MHIDAPGCAEGEKESQGEILAQGVYILGNIAKEDAVSRGNSEGGVLCPWLRTSISASPKK